MKSFNNLQVGDTVYGIRAYNLNWNDLILTTYRKITFMHDNYDRIIIMLDGGNYRLNPHRLSHTYNLNNWIFFADKEAFKNFIRDYLDVQSLAMQNLIKLSNKIDLL